MAIYDPITRQSVDILGKYPAQTYCFRFGARVPGNFRFVLARYGEQLPGFSGGFPPGTEREVDINDLVADSGSIEIEKIYELAKQISAPSVSPQCTTAKSVPRHTAKCRSRKRRGG